MKRILSIFLGIIIPICALATIKGGADKLINDVEPSLNIGVEVLDLTTGSTLYQRNANRSFIPASNMKLFSNAAAIMILGPDYRFRNQLSANAAELQQGRLHGSLYLHLSGDPSFTHERLAALFSGLKDWHIASIQGNIYIDSSHSTVAPYAPGWMQSDLVYSYGAPLSPLMVDANRLLVTVNPNDRIDAPAIIETNDPSGSIVINNQVKTKAKGTRCGLSFKMDSENHLNVHGCVTLGQWAVQQGMAIQNPLIFVQGLIKKQLQDENIQFPGNVFLGKAPAGSLLIATDTSKPIAQLMADTLKPSDNLYADSLFLHAAEKLNNARVNWSDAQILVKRFLAQQVGVDLNSAVLMDGSGLSRYDLLTPHQTVSLLHFLYDKFPMAYEYISALPVSGRDGTLQRRFKRPEQQDMVRAKTGTMTGIVSLSGYLYTANAHTLAFAIFLNKVPGTKLTVSGRFRYLVDALCTYFLQQKPANISWATVFSPHARIRFQQNPTQAELQRKRQAEWRRLETAVKSSLRGQAVAVLYRGNELVLQDNQVDMGKVWNALAALNKRYPFAVAVLSKEKPPLLGKRPFVFWTEANNNASRTWILREAVN